jgi:hypothetical protein
MSLVSELIRVERVPREQPDRSWTHPFGDLHREACAVGYAPGLPTEDAAFSASNSSVFRVVPKEITPELRPNSTPPHNRQMLLGAFPCHLFRLD